MLTDSFIEPGFLVAMCICLVTLIMPVFSRELRQSKSMVVGYLFVVGLHQVVAFVNAYIVGTFSHLVDVPWEDLRKIDFPIGLGTYDSHGFQLWGEKLAISRDWHFALGADFYKQALGAVYSLSLIHI